MYYPTLPAQFKRNTQSLKHKMWYGSKDKDARCVLSCISLWPSNKTNKVSCLRKVFIRNTKGKVLVLTSPLCQMCVCARPSAFRNTRNIIIILPLYRVWLTKKATLFNSGSTVKVIMHLIFYDLSDWANQGLQVNKVQPDTFEVNMLTI